MKQQLEFLFYFLVFLVPWCLGWAVLLVAAYAWFVTHVRILP